MQLCRSFSNNAVTSFIEEDYRFCQILFSKSQVNLRTESYVEHSRSLILEYMKREILSDYYAEWSLCWMTMMSDYYAEWLWRVTFMLNDYYAEWLRWLTCCIDLRQALSFIDTWILEKRRQFYSMHTSSMHDRLQIWVDCFQRKSSD